MTKENSTVCECGGRYTDKHNQDIHNKSKRHMRFLETGEKSKTYRTINMTEEEKLEKRREYFRDFYKKHPERWQACPSYNRGNGKPIKIN